MKKIQLILSAALLLSLPSCRFIKVNNSLLEGWGGEKTVIVASDTMASKDTTVGEFNALDCNVACNIVYTSGECAVSLTAPDNVIGYISIENKNGELVVKKDSKVSFNKLHKVSLKVACPELQAVKLNGAAEFSAPTGISAPEFSIDTNGAVDMEINGLKTGNARITANGSADIEVNGLDCSFMRMVVNGAGDIVLTGRADKAEAEINGAGDVDATGLECKDFCAQTHGIGKFKEPKQR